MGGEQPGQSPAGPGAIANGGSVARCVQGRLKPPQSLGIVAADPPEHHQYAGEAERERRLVPEAPVKRRPEIVDLDVQPRQPRLPAR